MASRQQIFTLSIGFTFVFAAINIWVPPSVTAPAETRASSLVHIIAQGHAAVPPPQPNYVRTSTPQVEGLQTPDQVITPNPVEVSQRTEYLDGKARVIQRVTRQGSPLGRDVVKIVAYDQFGRNAVDPLPFTMAATDGAYKTLTPAAHPLMTFYQAEHDKVANTSYPYAVTRYDNSPLNRVREQGAPGDDWQPGVTEPPHTLRYVYQTNRVEDAVLLWKPAGGGLRADDTYPPGSLHAEILYDEHNHRHWVFKDLGCCDLKRSNKSYGNHAPLLGK